MTKETWGNIAIGMIVLAIVIDVLVSHVRWEWWW